MILPQGIPGRAGDAREGEVCGIQWYIVRYQQPISFGQIGVGMAGVLRRGGFGGQVQHTVIQQTGLHQGLIFRDIKIAVDVSFNELAVPLADAVGDKQHRTVQLVQAVVQVAGGLHRFGIDAVGPAVDAPLACVAQHTEGQHRASHGPPGLAAQQQRADDGRTNHNNAPPDQQPAVETQHRQTVEAVGHKVKPLQQGVVSRARADGPAEGDEADAPHSGQRSQHPAAGGGELLVQRVQRDQQQRHKQRLQIPHVLPGRGGVQVLPHGDGPGDDPHTDEERQ